MSQSTPAVKFTKLTKAQAEFLRLVEAGRVSFTPSNHEWAAPSVAHRDMFLTFANGRKSNRTLAGTAVFHMDLIDIVGRREVALTEAGRDWLAAHPA